LLALGGFASRVRTLSLLALGGSFFSSGVRTLSLLALGGFASRVRN